MRPAVAVRAVVMVLIVLAAAAFVIDWNVLLEPTYRRQTDDAMLQGNPTELASRAAGVLSLVPVHDYAIVRAGALLFGIDAPDLVARRDQAEAELAQAEAAIDEAQAEIGLQAARLDAGQARIEGAAADLQRAQRERERQQKLLHTESYLQRDWQDAVAAEQRQRGTLEADRRALLATSVQIDVLRADLLGRQATLSGRRAALRLATIELGYTRITAPFDGIVTSRLARLGEVVAPGRRLITLVPSGEVWAVANFREGQVTEMRPGQRAWVRIDALPGLRLRGHVDSLEPSSQARGSLLPPDRATGSFTRVVQRIPVKIVFDHPPDLAGRLRPGLSAEVSVETGAASDAASLGGP